MRSGGVVGWVQEKMSCNRQPVPIRHLQPLSQGLRPCQLPLHRGAKPRGGRKLQRKKGLSALFFCLAESVGFEPTVLAHAGLVPHKSCAFAGAPFDLTASVATHSGSLRHDAGTGRRFLKTGAKKGLSALFFYLAESVGFEPTVLAHAGFQDRCLQPLGQLSG